MSSVPLSFFDRLATSYDQTWTNTRIGRAQRNAVWRELDRFIRKGDRVLDLGCGTGEDALHFLELGAAVDAIDSSAGMVDAARRRGVDARLLPIERVDELTSSYDLVLSNFGALNCVEDLARLREPLAKVIHPGGTLAISVINRFCVWETLYYGIRGQFRKASRRWSGRTQTSSGLRVFYPSARAIRFTFRPEFCLIRDTGIGVTVPPSYVHGVPDRAIGLFGRLDSSIGGSRMARASGDHRLLIFERSR